MPGDSNHNLERQLQDYAATRRQQAGGAFTVPPGTRRAVQQEVERQAARQTSPGAGLPWWSLLSVRLATLAGTVAVLAIAGVAWWQWNHSRPMEFAKRKVDQVTATERFGAPAGQLEERERALQRTDASRAMESMPASSDRPAAKPAQEVVVLADSLGTNAFVPAALATSNVEALNRDKDRAVVASPAGHVEPAAVPAAPAPEMDATLRYGLVRQPAAGVGGKEAQLAKPQVASAPPVSFRGDGDKNAVRLGAEVTGSKRELGSAPPSSAAAVADTRSARLASHGLAESKKSSELAKQPAPPNGRAAGVLAGATQANADSDFAVAVPALQPSDPAANGAVELGMAVNNQPVEARQAFQNQLAQPALRRNYNSPRRPAVLTGFQITTAGNLLQVTDADGSIYVGTIMPAAALSPSVSAARSVPGYENNLGRNANAKSDGTLGAFGGGFGETSQANTAGSSSNAYYAYDTRGGLSASEWLVSFTGTNRTLNQKVVFEGRWVIANPVALPNNLAPGNQIVQSGATNSVLRGQAVLDDRTRLEINATPTPSR